MKKIAFKYDKRKDIWCLLNKGKSSNNSPTPTKVYKQLVEQYGENPSDADASSFIDEYLAEHNVNVQEYIDHYQKDWDSMENEYNRKAESIFGISLPHNVIAYLTINNRSPYHIAKNYFYVPVPSRSIRKTVMHELWHFYTWYGLGEEQEMKLGEQKYNDIKEALTVLLNVECKDLLPKDVYDMGYPQHQELREKIVKLWECEKNIIKLWQKLSEES